MHKIAYVFAPAVLGEEVDGVEGAVLPLAPHHQQALLTALDHAQWLILHGLFKNCSSELRRTVAAPLDAFFYVIFFSDSENTTCTIQMHFFLGPLIFGGGPTFARK